MLAAAMTHADATGSLCKVTYRPSTDDLSLSNSQCCGVHLQQMLMVVMVVEGVGLCNAFGCGSSICRLEGSCCNLAICGRGCR